MNAKKWRIKLYSHNAQRRSAIGTRKKILLDQDGTHPVKWAQGELTGSGFAVKTHQPVIPQPIQERRMASAFIVAMGETALAKWRKW